VSGDDVVTDRSGIRRGLVATSTADGHFAIVALDHVASMAATMVPDNPATVTGDQLVDAKAQITDRLRHSASAVLLDPMDGYSTVHTPAELADGIGLVLGIEASDYTSDHVAPHLLEGWSVERAAEAGADAVKISFPFDPQQETHLVEQFVADVAAQSQRYQLPLFAEPLGVWRSPDDRRQVTIAAAQRFGDLGVTVLKLEFPIDVTVIDDEHAWFQACAELDAASPVPWTVLSGGEPFERFHAMMRVACDAGASGFVAGRALWRECVAGGSVDTSAVEQAARRLEQLMALVDDRAEPWFAHRSWSATTRDGGGT
jgi:tagatose 1,6-diphosphate aldolase